MPEVIGPSHWSHHRRWPEEWDGLREAVKADFERVLWCLENCIGLHPYKIGLIISVLRTMSRVSMWRTDRGKWHHKCDCWIGILDIFMTRENRKNWKTDMRKDRINSNEITQKIKTYLPNKSGIKCYERISMIPKYPVWKWDSLPSQKGKHAWEKREDMVGLI